MEISPAELKLIKRFQKDLHAYYEVANAVYSAVNDHEYVSSEEFSKRKRREEAARGKLNILFGEVEQLFYNLISGKPYFSMAAFPGHRIDVMAEALSSNFETSMKGRCLERAVQAVDQAVGKAAGLSKKPKPIPSTKSLEILPNTLVKRIGDEKLRALCQEFNRVSNENPNAGALLLRTIFLITLQKKLGTKAKEDLGPVLEQAIAQDIYQDKAIKRILSDLSKIPKTMLDMSHHSQWVIIKPEELTHWAQGVSRVLEKTY